MTEPDEPIWGTPQPSADHEVPVWGSPGVTPPPQPAAGPLTPDLAFALGQSPELVVLENAAMFGEGGFDVRTPQGATVASLSADSSAATMFFGALAGSRQILRDPRGVVVAELRRNGSFFDNGTYEIIDPHGTPLAEIRQESAFFSVRLLILGPVGRPLRLLGGSWGSDRFEVVDGTDETQVLATVHRRGNGLFSSTHHYPVRFAPGMPVLERFLVLAATICLDQVTDKD